MNVECPHCGANYPMHEEQLAGQSKPQGLCKWCNCSFTIIAPGDLAPLPVKQTAILAAIEGPVRGQLFRLSKARTVLGRASDADIVIYDPEISRKHCTIELHGSTASLIDLGTTNGTLVDGKRIDDRCELKHLSRFRIGATILVFTVKDQADDSKSPATLVVGSRRSV